MLLNCGVGEDSRESLGEIEPVNSKGNQSWIFIGRTDAEAETRILWHLLQRTDSSEKTLMQPGGLQSMGSQRVRNDWVTELNWTELSRPGHWLVLQFQSSSMFASLALGLLICEMNRSDYLSIHSLSVFLHCQLCWPICPDRVCHWLQFHPLYIRLVCVAEWKKERKKEKASSKEMQILQKSIKMIIVLGVCL